MCIYVHTYMNGRWGGPVESNYGHRIARVFHQSPKKTKGCCRCRGLSSCRVIIVDFLSGPHITDAARVFIVIVYNIIQYYTKYTTTCLMMDRILYTHITFFIHTFDLNLKYCSACNFLDLILNYWRECIDDEAEQLRLLHLSNSYPPKEL